MGLRDIESTLPPGFRFFPSDEELVCHYLYQKVSNERIDTEGTMVEVDLHTSEPWELPEVAKLSSNEWYFFSFRDRKYATGSRTNRATKSGYWKATGKDRTIYDSSTREVAGMRKTLVFYRGRAPNGIKSSWVMHEFRLENPHSPPKEDWVLCRVFHKWKGEEEELNMSSSCFSPSHILSSPPPLPLQAGEIISTSSCHGSHQENNNNNNNNNNNCSSSSSFVDVSNLLHCNLLDYFTPEVGMGPTDGVEEFGLFLDESAMGEVRFEVGRDEPYY